MKAEYAVHDVIPSGFSWDGQEGFSWRGSTYATKEDLFSAAKAEGIEALHIEDCERTNRRQFYGGGGHRFRPETGRIYNCSTGAVIPGEMQYDYTTLGWLVESAVLWEGSWDTTAVRVLADGTLQYKHTGSVSPACQDWYEPLMFGLNEPEIPLVRCNAAGQRWLRAGPELWVPIDRPS